MHRYVVAGNPVEHSQSPFIHTEFARQTGQMLEYAKLPCPLDDFAGTLQRFAQDRSAGTARGCNITVPFKFEAFELATRHTARAALAQAANTLRFDADGWFADNTDGAGLVRDIERNAGVLLHGKRVLLIGAGGAAAGALGPLLAARPAELVLANRTLDKANALVARHAAAALGVSLRAAALNDCGERFDVLINATSSSLNTDTLTLPAHVFGDQALAVDMMYGAPALGFLNACAAQGAQGRDGLGMLVEQAAESFMLWRGVRPQTAPVLAALRARLAEGHKA